jgi:hypothetical protein
LPNAPQAVFEVPGWQNVPSQQPLPQLCEDALQTQVLPVQMGVVPLHVTQSAPPAPQAVGELPCPQVPDGVPKAVQHPVGQLCESH